MGTFLCLTVSLYFSLDGLVQRNKHCVVYSLKWNTPLNGVVVPDILNISYACKKINNKSMELSASWICT